MSDLVLSRRARVVRKLPAALAPMRLPQSPDCDMRRAPCNAFFSGKVFTSLASSSTSSMIYHAWADDDPILYRGGRL
jgi:hypothetical protein